MTVKEYETARRRFVLRAEAEGLIDVAAEQHDIPLGPITLAATTKGVVRIGLPNSGTHRQKCLLLSARELEAHETRGWPSGRLHQLLLGQRLAFGLRPLPTIEQLASGRTKEDRPEEPRVRRVYLGD